MGTILTPVTRHFTGIVLCVCVGLKTCVVSWFTGMKRGFDTVAEYESTGIRLSTEHFKFVS